MALKYREELVGKRFLALKDPKVQIPSSKSPNPRRVESEEELSPEELIKQVQSNVSVLDSLEVGDWLSGVIRAATDKDYSKEDFQILVEFDHLHWSRRDWIKPADLRILLVEETLLLAHRFNDEENKKTWSPALKFKYLTDSTGSACQSVHQPVQFLVDNNISLVSAESTLSYKESAKGLEDECRVAAQSWIDYQDGQSILVSTPTVLVGYRVQVYRTEGTTQWFTAVIQNYHEQKKELTLLDDTVLEEHFESAELTQIIPLDGVVESILKGTQVRTTQRRSRACKENKSNSSETSANNKSNSSTEVKSTASESASTQVYRSNSCPNCLWNF